MTISLFLISFFTCGVSISHKLKRINLGGVEQYILICSEDKTKPVLLYLHGGPGKAAIPYTDYFMNKLKKSFVVINWDQRGAGKSFSVDIPLESMNLEQFISDTYELVQMLRRWFNKDKIYLVGHSWGSLLGILTVSRYPEFFHAFISIGQIVDPKRTEKLSYEFTLKKAIETDNREAIDELNLIGPPPYGIDKIVIQRKWLKRFGGLFHKLDTDSRLFELFESSCLYTLKDRMNYFNANRISLNIMWEELSKINLFEQVRRIEVPVYFFIGRYDYNTPSFLVKSYCNILEAPKGKQIIWFEDSAHYPHFEQPHTFQDIIINKVLSDD